MNKIAMFISNELCEFYIIPQLLSFANDPKYSVRESIAGNFINICKSLPLKTFKNKLLPIFKILSNDFDENVRKSVVLILPNFAECGIEEKNLIDLFVKFIKDESNGVKGNLLKIFGKVINFISKEEIMENEIILNFYKYIINKYSSDLKILEKINYYGSNVQEITEVLLK